MRETATHHHMPRRRAGHTTSVTIGGERFFLTTNGRDDGSLGEVFISWGKPGTTGAGLMAVYAAGLSVALQHRVPLAEIVRHGLTMSFVPDGRTDDPEIPHVRSIADYTARRLAIDWLPYEQRAELGIFTVAERVEPTMDRAMAHHAHLARIGPGPVPWRPAMATAR